MPGTLGQLIRNRRRIDIPLGDGNSIFIEYRPAAITPRLEEELNAARADAADRKQVFAAVTNYLLAVISQWDVTSKRTGEVIPLTPEGFYDDVDYDELMFLWDTITDDANMGEANGANSSEPSESTSKPMEPQATKPRPSRRGTH